MNTTKSESTGYTPHELLFGEKARTPVNFPSHEELATYDKFLADTTAALTQLRTLAAMNSVQAKCRSKVYYDRRVNAKHFREGEMVYLLKDPKPGKLEGEYVGPCEILEIDYGSLNVKIQKGNRTRVVHMDKIKKAYDMDLQNEEIRNDSED